MPIINRSNAIWIRVFSLVLGWFLRATRSLCILAFPNHKTFGNFHSIHLLAPPLACSKALILDDQRIHDLLSLATLRTWKHRSVFFQHSGMSFWLPLLLLFDSQLHDRPWHDHYLTYKLQHCTYLNSKKNSRNWFLYSLSNYYLIHDGKLNIHIFA